MCSRTTKLLHYNILAQNSPVTVCVLLIVSQQSAQLHLPFLQQQRLAQHAPINLNKPNPSPNGAVNTVNASEMNSASGHKQQWNFRQFSRSCNLCQSQHFCSLSASSCICTPSQYS
mmetsp:Transcript_40355/g.64689  ORF Transcript_40355/g.64689 Transcript_40355/m.64689 type:complete len:116 (+) Transcript_40355:99-446(+)